MALVLFIGFIGLILLRVPVSMAIGAAVLLAFLTSEFSDALYIVPQQILEGVNKPSLAAVPFFIMAGNLMNAVGMTDRIFNFANALVGHFKAGLAQVNVLSSMIFAGVSGAAVADCAGLGAIEQVPARLRRGDLRADRLAGRVPRGHAGVRAPGRLRGHDFPTQPRVPARMLRRGVDGVVRRGSSRSILGGIVTAPRPGCWRAASCYRTLPAGADGHDADAVIMIIIGFSRMGWLLAIEQVPARLGEAL